MGTVLAGFQGSLSDCSTGARGSGSVVMMVMIIIIPEEEGAVMRRGRGRGREFPPSLMQSRLIDLPTTMPFKMTFF
jgi:hypothetical protein